MCDFEHSTQLTKWLYTPEQLAQVRRRANRTACQALNEKSKADSSTTNSMTTTTTTTTTTTGESLVVPVEWFASGFATAASPSKNDTTIKEEDDAERREEAFYLNAEEEGLLIQFYASKLPSLIGPMAQVSRLRRDNKVVATAALFLRRFYLSNSVLVHDPKAILVAAAFLASKAEDATVDVRNLEDGTKALQAHVEINDICTAELFLLTGLHFDLLCFHPYKAVLAYTEDLRIFLKSEKGRHCCDSATPIVGQDLKPMHDEAVSIVDDAVISDIPLMYSPGQVGLAALMVANDITSRTNNNTNISNNGQAEEESSSQQPAHKSKSPKIHFDGYIQSRFAEQQKESDLAGILQQMQTLCTMLRGLREGKYGCGNHGVDMAELKRVHKKSKKCAVWSTKKKKLKKRKLVDDSNHTDTITPP
eukprot:scaffold12806_cov55-Attheya_sp.AAC.4